MRKHVAKMELLTAQVHGNYVDCARWVGDLVVSKSVDDKMLLWLPELEGFEPRALQEGRYTIVQVWKVVARVRGVHTASVFCTLARVESHSTKGIQAQSTTPVPAWHCDTPSNNPNHHPASHARRGAPPTP